MNGERCKHCGLQYQAMRTGLTYRDVFGMFWVGGKDPSTWKQKRRNTILGRWHQLKLEMWDHHLETCKNGQNSKQTNAPLVLQ